MTRILTLSLAFLLALTGYAEAQSLAIFDANTSPPNIRVQGVSASLQSDGTFLIKNGSKDPWPGVHLEGKWDLSEYDAVEFTAISTSEEKFTLNLRIDCAQSDVKTLDGVLQNGHEIKPGEKLVWRYPLPKSINADTRQKLFAMRGKPGGITTDSYSKDIKIQFNSSEVTAFRPFVTQNQKNNSWILVSIAAVRSDDAKPREEYLDWAPDKFFPMIDEFGQFKHGDWPGKTHSLEELRAQIETENKELAQHNPSEFDKYGGWKNGPQLDATGAFRTEKVDGVWYLVDPDGKLFWSNGIDCVAYWGATTPISDREFYFDPDTPMRPEQGNPLSQFLSERDQSVNNYYANYGKFWQYNFTAANLYKKWGDDWQAKETELIGRRLRSWGLNTIGNWSDPSVYRSAKIPYTATLGTSARKIEGSEGYWGKFVDPFAPEFAQSVHKSFNGLKWTADDPYCVGYFVDNEISWGEAGSLAKAALASPKDQPAKIAYVAWLKERYDSIEAFNKAWETEVESWDALQNEPFKTPDSNAAKEDSNLFYTVICEKYFSEIVGALRELAPNKLYLGCRFAWTNELARRAGQKFCDVVSYNFYKTEVASFEPVEGEDKPVMIGEFHFGALDRGMFHCGLCPCKDQQERADSYANYVKSALSNPWIVGAHWFEYGDEPTTGRFDGENYQIGFVDVCDRPYQETIDASREVGYKIYDIRKNECKKR